MAVRLDTTQTEPVHQWTTAQLALTVVAGAPVPEVAVEMEQRPPPPNASQTSDQASVQFAHGYALLIGIDEHSESQWSLPVAGKGVIALRDVLTNADYCGYRPEHVNLLRGKEATRQGIFGGLTWLRSSLEQDDSGSATAIIYYSGHGWLDNRQGSHEPYLIPYDVLRSELLSTALSASQLGTFVADIQPARLFLIFDCSHAAAISTEVAKQLANDTSYAMLASAQRTEQAHLRPDGEMSVFTYHLLEALTGASPSQEDDQEVLVVDVINYVSRSVSRSAKEQVDREQQPEFQISGGNFPIGLLLGGRGISKR